MHEKEKKGWQSKKRMTEQSERIQRWDCYNFHYITTITCHNVLCEQELEEVPVFMFSCVLCECSSARKEKLSNTDMEDSSNVTMKIIYLISSSCMLEFVYHK